jgi:hypothetical protein
MLKGVGGLDSMDPKSAANAVSAQLGMTPEINNPKCKRKLEETIKKFGAFKEKMGQLKEGMNFLKELEKVDQLFPKGQQVSFTRKDNKILKQLNKLDKLDDEIHDKLIECEKRSQPGYPMDEFKKLGDFKSFFKGGANFKDKFKNFFGPKKLKDLTNIRKMCKENLKTEAQKCKLLQKYACKMMDMMEGKGMPIDNMNFKDFKGMQKMMRKMQEPLNEMKGLDAKVKNCDNLAKLSEGKGNPKKMFMKTVKDAGTAGVTGLFFG